MAKKATIGDSPKDRSMNIIDKFIKREERKNKHKEILPARRKAKDVPIDLWPLGESISSTKIRQKIWQLYRLVRYN